MDQIITVLAVAVMKENTESRQNAGYCVSLLRNGLVTDQWIGRIEVGEGMPSYYGPGGSGTHYATKIKLDAVAHALTMCVQQLHESNTTDIKVYVHNQQIKDMLLNRIGKMSDTLKVTVTRIKEVIAEAKKKFPKLQILSMPQGDWTKKYIPVSEFKGGCDELLTNMSAKALMGATSASQVRPQHNLITMSDDASFEERKREYFTVDRLLQRIMEAEAESQNNMIRLNISDLGEHGNREEALGIVQIMLTHDEAQTQEEIVKYIKESALFRISVNSSTTPFDWQYHTTGCGVCYLFSMFQIYQLSEGEEYEPSNVPFNEVYRNKCKIWLTTIILPHLRSKVRTDGDSEERSYRIKLTERTIAFLDKYTDGDQLPNTDELRWGDRSFLEEIMYHVLGEAEVQHLERLSNTQQQIIYDSRVNDPTTYHDSRFTFEQVLTILDNGDAYRQMFHHNHYFLTARDKKRTLEARQAVNKLAREISRLCHEFKNGIAVCQDVDNFFNDGVHAVNEDDYDTSPLQIDNDEGPGVHGNAIQGDIVVNEDNRNRVIEQNNVQMQPIPLMPKRIWTAEDFNRIELCEGKRGLTYMKCTCGKELTITHWKSETNRNKHFKHKDHTKFVVKELLEKNGGGEEAIDNHDLDQDMPDDLNVDMPLIDILPNDLPSVLVRMMDPIAVPDNLVKVVRLVFNNILKEAANDPQDERKSLKVCLIAAVLTTPLHQRTKRQGIRLMLDYVVRDRWDLITIRHFKFKSVKKGKQVTANQTLASEEMRTTGLPNAIIKAVTSLAKDGEISKAMKLLTRTEALPLGDANTVQRLRNKHPEANTDVDIEDGLLKRLKDFKPTREMHITVDPDRLRKIIRTGHKHLRSGPDKGTFEFYAALIGYGSADCQDEIEFGVALAKFFELVLNVKLKESIMKFIRDIELIALAKGEEDIRPIGLNTFLRKLATILFMDEVNSCTAAGGKWIETYFGDLQMQGARNGTEKIVHLMRELHIRYPELSIAAMDGDNAFNRGSRLQGLVNIMEQQPRLLNFVNAMYGADMYTHGHFLTNIADADKRVAKIDLLEGCVQGDVMATWFYGMIIQPFLDQISALLNASSQNVPQIVRAFVDDTNCAAEFDNLMQVLEFVIREGPKYGYYVKFNKGAYLLGKCDTLTIANSQVNALMDLGFIREIIHIHPANYDTSTMSVEEIIHIRSNYGVKILGCFIGDPLYVRSMMEKKCAQLSETADTLCLFPDNQIKNLMLRWCFSSKINFWLRTHNPQETGQLVDDFVLMQKQILCSILNPIKRTLFDADNMDDLLWAQSQLNINQGGLGLGNHSEVRHAAFTASFTESMAYIQRVLPNIVVEADDIHCVHLLPYKEAITHLKSFSPNLTPLEVRRIMEDIVNPHDENEDLRSLQNALSIPFKTGMLKTFLRDIEDDISRTAWFKGLVNGSAGAWLSQPPRKESFRLDSAQFHASLLLRFHADLNAFYPPGSSCECKGCPKLDSKGKHILSGCNMGGYRNLTHDTDCAQLHSMFIQCGFNSTREARCQFISNPTDYYKRPDVTIINGPFGTGVKMHFDVRVSYPQKDKRNVAVITEDSQEDSQVFQEAEEEKNRRYTWGVHYPYKPWYHVWQSWIGISQSA